MQCNEAERKNKRSPRHFKRHRSGRTKPITLLCFLLEGKNAPYSFARTHRSQWRQLSAILGPPHPQSVSLWLLLLLLLRDLKLTPHCGTSQCWQLQHDSPRSKFRFWTSTSSSTSTSKWSSAFQWHCDWIWIWSWGWMRTAERRGASAVAWQCFWGQRWRSGTC